MRVRGAGPEERERFWTLVDEGLRRPGAPTGPRDDFPVALGEANREGWLVAEAGGAIRACCATLARPFATPAGPVAVGLIGSVVTEPAWRGRGLSAALQEAALARLRAGGAALAVLWSDRPEVYRARGFVPAGIELMADLTAWRAPGAAPAAARPYTGADLDAVVRLHEAHPLRALRAPGDAPALYGMPGTRGLVLPGPGPAGISAYLFAGKGQDFPLTVAEWGGDLAGVVALLARAKADGLARRVLLPQGAETLARRLAAGGALVWAQPSGLWRVLDSGRLRAVAGAAPAGAGDEAPAWLGWVGEDGAPRPGPLALAVWGLDSI